jgi:hypothetical protein
MKYKAREDKAYNTSVKRNTLRDGPSLTVDKLNKTAEGETNQVEKEVILSEEEKDTYLFILKPRYDIMGRLGGVDMS